MREIDTKPQNRRSISNWLINPRYQLKYIFWLTTTGLVLTALNAIVFYFYVSENYSILVDLSPMTEEAKLQLYSELRQIVVMLSAISAMFLTVVGIIGVVFSHRTAGPLYHFKKIFGLIREGRTDMRVRLRPNDDFQDVASSFNEMMDSLETKMK
ncbi:MAG: methyl-accepting chemotaxis protein [Bdellovibrionota bacterium]